MTPAEGSDQRSDPSPPATTTAVPEADPRLARLEHQFAEIQRLAQIGSWEWDVPANVVTWSDELFRIYGIEPTGFDATYEAFLERVHPDDRDMVNDAVQRAYADRSGYSFDHRLVRPDGTTRWLHGRGNVIADDNGDPVRLYGVAIDITDRKLSERYLRDFISNASHELRTPVSAIRQAVQILAVSKLSPDDRNAAMAALARQAERLHELSTDLLALDSVEEAAEPVMLGPVRLAGAVRGAAEAATGRGTANLAMGIAADIAVLAEPAKLERIFTNLLANAYAYGGPNVSITASHRSDEVIVEVRDDGPGVPPEYLPSLFAPFATNRTAGGGSGLGLAVVRQLVEAFGGAVTYRRAEPHGAVFTLRLSKAGPA